MQKEFKNLTINVETTKRKSLEMSFIVYWCFVKEFQFIVRRITLKLQQRKFRMNYYQQRKRVFNTTCQNIV